MDKKTSEFDNTVSHFHLILSEPQNKAYIFPTERKKRDILTEIISAP
jgi:hypothetical protein